MNGTSYSAINTYQRCPRLYHYKYNLDLQPKKRSIALHQGTNAHEMLKVYFLALQEGDNTDVAWQALGNYAATLYDAQKEYLFEDELADHHALIDEALSWVEGYCNQYGEEWEVLHVEEEFLIMLQESGEVVTFTPDLVVRDRNGFVWIIDHKTTATIPASGIPFGDMQALLYYAGVKSLYPECRGFIFNRLRKKIPTQPRLTKTGDKRVANLLKIDTTYEVLRDFLREEAPELLKDPVHQRRLAELRDAEDRWFWTEQVYVNEATEENVLDDVESVLFFMQDSRTHGMYPRNLQEDRGYLSCGRCAFQPLCHADMVGWDTEKLIEESYEPRDPKNPYTEEGGSDVSDS